MPPGRTFRAESGIFCLWRHDLRPQNIQFCHKSKLSFEKLNDIVSAFLWMRCTGLPPLWNCERGVCAVLLRVEEGAGHVLQLIDLSSLLQRLIWHLSLLLHTQSSAFPKSFTPMGIFEFDKLHCLRGDKREQSWFLFKPGHSVVTRHVFKQTATPGAHQKKKKKDGKQGRLRMEPKPRAAWGELQKAFPQQDEGRDQMSSDMLMSETFQQQGRFMWTKTSPILLKKWIDCPPPAPREAQGPLESSHLSHLLV